MNVWIERRWISEKILPGITEFDICCIPACLQPRDSDYEQNPDGGQEETSSYGRDAGKPVWRQLRCCCRRKI